MLKKCTAVMLGAMSVAAPAFAQAPDAARVRAAAEHFDAGVAAFKQHNFEDAASHFEAADAAVPSPKALRQAIRARVEAGQGSRAATLAALAADRNGGDEATTRLARETMDRFGPRLQRILVSCASPCVLAVGTRSVPGEANTRWSVYVDPGPATIRASFFGGAASPARDIDAKAGGVIELRFEPEEKKTSTPSAPATPATPRVPAPEAPPQAPATQTPDAPIEPERKGISPAFFGTSLGVTAVLGGVLIWSGIDTKNNPGPDAVKTACWGKGPDCPEYKQGLAKQLRTNVLVGATATAAAATLVLGIFTNWRGANHAPAEVTAIDVPRGAGLGVAGKF